MKQLRPLLAAALILWVLAIPLAVSAAGIEHISLAVSQTTVREGEEIEITLSIPAGQSFHSLMGTLVFDTDHFSLPAQEDFVLHGGWSDLYFNPENGQFVLIHRQGSSGEAVLTVSLTAKDTLTAGQTDISVTGIALSDGKTEQSPADATVRLDTVSPLLPSPDPDSSQTGSGSAFPEALPATGDTSLGTELMLCLLFAAIVTAAVLLAVRHRKMAHAAKMLAWVCVVGSSAVLVVAGVYAEGWKGDLDGSGTCDYTDIHLLQKHLIGLEELPASFHRAADLNNDDRLTVADLALLVRNAEKNLVYTVQLSSSTAQRFYEKNTEAVLQFQADVSYGAVIRQVTLNGSRYTAKKATDDPVYTVQVPVGQSAGAQELHIDSVLLDCEREVSVDYTETIEVLRDIPQISDFLAEEITASAQMKISFTVNDPDEALTSANMEILRQTDGEYSSVDSKPVTSGRNEFVLDLEENTPYLLHIMGHYDRSTGTLETDEEHTGTLDMTKPVQLDLEYEFHFDGLASMTQDGVATGVFAKGQPVGLRFNSENATDFLPERIIVNGISYPVYQLEDGYAATLPGFAQHGETLLTVEAVVLENGRSFALQEGNTLSITVQKEMPAVRNASVQEDFDSRMLRVSFRLDDPDGALRDARLRVLDFSGQLIREISLLSPDFNEEIDVSSAGLTQGYHLAVLAECDLTGADPQPDTILWQTDLTALPRAEVGSARTDLPTVEKSAPVQLYYTLRHNTAADVEKLVVNNQELSAQLLQDGSWTVTATAADRAGIQEFFLSQVVFSDGSIAPVDATVSVEVERSAPTVENYRMEELYDAGQIQADFLLRDDDSALREGVLTLVRDSDGLVVHQETLDTAGEYSFTFPVDELTAYTLSVAISWDRIQDGSLPVDNQLALQKPVFLVQDYALSVSEIAAFTPQGDKQIYFEPLAPVAVRFTAKNAANFSAVSAQINGEVHPLSPLGSDVYEAQLSGFAAAGVQTLQIETLWLENGKELAVTQTAQTAMEILKTVPQVTEFQAEKTPQDELLVQFRLLDDDGALTAAAVQILEEDGTVLLSEPVSAGTHSASVALTNSDSYLVRVTADYDRDTNALDSNSNTYTGQELFAQFVNASKDAIQLKGITDSTLYRKSADGGMEQVAVLDVTGGLPSDTENYIVLIEMENLPDFYAGVREFRKNSADGRVYVVVEQTDMVQYTADGARAAEHIFAIPHKDAQGEHPVIASAKELFLQMAADPAGSYQLTQDLDASELDSTAAAVAAVFTGELDGNGYRILNLPTVMFQQVKGGYIHDLVIENAYVTGSHRAILANTVQGGSRIENVTVRSSFLKSNQDGSGIFAGIMNQSAILRSTAHDINLQGFVSVGGLVGKLGAGSEITDCFVSGKLSGSYDHPSLGARVGGITGWHEGSSILRCVTNVQIQAPSRKGNGGIIGGPNKTAPALENCLSMGGGTAYRIAGFDVLSNAVNLYEFSGSSAATNITEANQAQVHQTDALHDPAFYTDNLGFDAAVWDLDGVVYGKNPLPHGASVSENTHSIPSYETLVQLDGYDPQRETAYSNLAVLLPFADMAEWIELAAQLPQDSVWNTQSIQTVMPLNAQGEPVHGVTHDAPDSAAKLRVLFSNGTSLECDLQLKKVLGDLVAVYESGDLPFPYQFHRYVSNPDPAALSQAVQTAAQWEYSVLAQLTAEEESRLYTDYYEESVRPRLEELVGTLVVSEDAYPFYSQNPLVRQLAADRLLEENTLQRTLYAYTYYDKWYRIDFGGVVLSDLMFFSGQSLSDDWSMSWLVDKLFSVPSGQRATSETYVFYQNHLKPSTGMNLDAYLSYLATAVGGYSSANDWFTQTFGGVLVEQSPDNNTTGIEWRAWDVLSNLDSRKRILLPLLTAPQEDMYLISTASQIVLGSMNRYPTYLNKDGQERERMRAIMEDYAVKMGHFYGVSSAWIDGAADILNSFANIQYDTRFNFPAGSAATPGTQEKGVTQDPVIKWVYEAVGSWNAQNGSGAYANGSDVYWVVNTALTTGGSNEYVFFVFSHETAHNQDGRYFYGGKGRRAGTGPEAHADGNISQEMRDGCMVFNISAVKDIGTEMTNNFSYERIDTAEKVHDYYKKMFDTGYVLDYLAAKAFLSLTPDQQAAVAVQASEIPSGNTFQSVYRRLTADQLAEMNLQSVADLWDNKILLRPAGTISSGFGDYGFESFYNMNWYQPHNDNGLPDHASFKRLGQEMLGFAGYSDGYMVYMSARSKNDLDALRQITQNPTITWREYKLDRYAEVEQNLHTIPYFDPEDVVEMFRTAFVGDAENGNINRSLGVKRTLYGLVKRATGDFADGGIYQQPSVIAITSAEQLVELASRNTYGYYRLEADLDFSAVSAQDGSYIPQRFIGILDGNGHTLRGMHYPLFADLQYAQIHDLTIERPSYHSDAVAMLAARTRQVLVGNLTVQDADLQLPLVKNKNEGYYEYGTVQVSIGKVVISTPEQLLAIGNSVENRKKNYILQADLDLSGIAAEDFIVSGTFSGTLDGNGYTISGANAVLFEKTDGAQIHNLTLRGTVLTKNTQKGAFANTVSDSMLENIRIIDASIQNNTNQAGGLAGVVVRSSVRRVAVENLSLRASNTLGGVAGQIDRSFVEDCLVTGALEGTLSHTLGARVGGVTGWLSNDSLLMNCITDVQISAPKETGNGGIIGGPNSGEAYIQNSVSLGGGTAYRIAGFPVLGGSSNVYELDTSNSLTNQTDTTQGILSAVSSETASSRQFYLDMLGWSETVWNFDELAAGGLPSLR